MRRFSQRSHLVTLSEINITPLLDLAFVLLTFGYLIPKGMETWGRKLPRAEKAAFLHLWRVVGHVMGIRDDLMTDDLDDGVRYDAVLALGKHGSRLAIRPLIEIALDPSVNRNRTPWFLETDPSTGSLYSKTSAVLTTNDLTCVISFVLAFSVSMTFSAAAESTFS